jgi:hypothetical protein
MKVICIEETIQFGNVPSPSPVVGCEYTIVRRFTFEGFELCELAEFPRKDGYLFGYDVKAFAPLNGPDERERLEAYLQKQEKMDKVLMALAETSDEPMPQDAFDRVWKNIQSTL